MKRSNAVYGRGGACGHYRCDRRLAVVADRGVDAERFAQPRASTVGNYQQRRGERERRTAARGKHARGYRAAGGAGVCDVPADGVDPVAPPERAVQRRP